MEDRIGFLEAEEGRGLVLVNHMLWQVRNNISSYFLSHKPFRIRG